MKPCCQYCVMENDLFVCEECLQNEKDENTKLTIGIHVLKNKIKKLNKNMLLLSISTQ